MIFLGLWWACGLPKLLQLGKYIWVYFWFRNSGLDPIFRKDSGFDPGCHIWYSELERYDSSSCRRWGHEGWWYNPTMDKDLEGGDTKPTGRYYPTMTREVRSGPMGYQFRPDEDVRNLSGGVMRRLKDMLQQNFSE